MVLWVSPCLFERSECPSPDALVEEERLDSFEYNRSGGEGWFYGAAGKVVAVSAGRPVVEERTSETDGERATASSELTQRATLRFQRGGLRRHKAELGSSRRHTLANPLNSELFVFCKDQGQRSRENNTKRGGKRRVAGGRIWHTRHEESSPFVKPHKRRNSPASGTRDLSARPDLDPLLRWLFLARSRLR